MRKRYFTTTTLNVNTSYDGERIEQKISRIITNKEPITDKAPLIYTQRKDGVQPDYDIRTDKWEHAVTAADFISKTMIAKRDNKPELPKGTTQEPVQSIEPK